MLLLLNIGVLLVQSPAASVSVPSGMRDAPPNAVGLPVAGDPVYGVDRRASAELGLRRQALHAACLGFDHPQTNERLRFDSELPADLASVIRDLRR